MEARQILDRARQTLRLTAERWHLLRFWRWWMGELETLVPISVRAWHLRRRRMDTAEFEGTQLVVRTQAMEGWIERARIELANLDTSEQTALIRSELQRALQVEHAPIRLALVLSPAQSLRKHLRLPQAVEESLHAAIAFEMDRYTPFRAEHVYFDCAVIARDYEARQIDIALAVAARSVVDGARARLETAGAQVVAVLPAGSDGQGLNLLPQAQRPTQQWRVKRAGLVAGGAMAALLLLAIALPIFQKRAQLVALSPLVAKAYEQALLADDMQRKLDTMVSDYNYLLQKKRGNPSALQIVDEVTRLLPDDTWVQQFELKTDSKAPSKPRQVQLQGETGSSGKMIGLIESAKFLTQASWRSPLTTGAPGSGERFDLVATVKPIPPSEQA